jgi:hypothetical protein
MFVQNDNGERVQVGWASPKDESGVRTFEYSPGFQGTRPRDVSFEDDELTQKVAEEQHNARLGDGTDGEKFEVEVQPADEPVEVTPVAPEPVDASPDQVEAPRVDAAPDAEQADEPTEDSVELNTGGAIVASDDDDEAEFQRLLAEEEAEATKPQTRRNFRDDKS